MLDKFRFVERNNVYVILWETNKVSYNHTKH